MSPDVVAAQEEAAWAEYQRQEEQAALDAEGALRQMADGPDVHAKQYPLAA